MLINNLFEEIQKQNVENKFIPWPKNVNIGWWLDNDPVRFYHGTHKRNLEYILQNGLYAPKSGPTANLVSLALEPNTSLGYAAMSGSGGETSFRSVKSKATHTPISERIVFIFDIPQSYFLNKMTHQRGAVKKYRTKLTNKEEYKEAKTEGKRDTEYYALTEIRLPIFVPSSFIVGWTKKS